jgi:hypothetical protein
MGRVTKAAPHPARRPAKRPPIRPTKSRRKRLLIVLAPVAAVVVAVGVLVAVNAAGKHGPSSGKTGETAASAVIAQVTGVPASTFDAVGAGQPLSVPQAVQAPPITADGKPRVLYIGAEYCPFCAAERWPVIVALARFGTWSGLSYSYSAASPEVYPNTPTFTFHGASYQSNYLSFTGVETHTNKVKGNGYEPLDTLSATDSRLMQAYDPRGVIPIVIIGGTYLADQAMVSPDVFKGLTQAQIAAALADPTSKIGSAVDAAANAVSATLCKITNGQPANVCTSPGVVAAAKTLQ